MVKAFPYAEVDLFSPLRNFGYYFDGTVAAGQAVGMGAI